MERILYLVRHGETDYVKDDRIQGRQNIPLNKKGFSEAKTLADYFKNKKIKIIITSNLKRSIQTGELIKKLCPSAKLIKDSGFDEKDYGLWQNELWPTIYKKNPNLKQTWIKQGVKFRPPKGESVEEFIKRVKSSFMNILNRFPTGDLIFAIHGGSIKMILGLMKNIPENEFYTQTFINTGSIQIVKDKGRVFEIGENITVFH